jgi:hypothetical protein
MSVYVDNMRAPLKRGRRTYIMCHMIADSTEELHAMAQRIGAPISGFEDAGTYREHYDICKTKRALAVANGAIEVTMSQLGRKLLARRGAA